MKAIFSTNFLDPPFEAHWYVKCVNMLKKFNELSTEAFEPSTEKFSRVWRSPYLERFFTKSRQFLEIIHTTFSFSNSFTLNLKIQIFTATQSLAILWKQILFVLNFL